MNYRSSQIIMLLIVMLVIFGCSREKVSDKTPIHLNPNMDHQPKYKAQAASDFFENGSAMRPLVEGTVAQGWLREDIKYYTGKDKKGNFISTAPVEISMDRLKRGQERFNIFCSPCHSRVGDGKGIMAKEDYQYVVPPNFHSDSVMQFTDGYIFNVVSNGVRNMPSYKHQIPVDDRWSIVLYLRALQKSHNATIDDIPASIREEVK
ncbi:MAG: cytochrome c [candidate division Zixibacteria bacterium]|nr:cytochrome c [candidate division Zixibacteria bacterium]